MVIRCLVFKILQRPSADVAKNYLIEKEIKDLERIVSQVSRLCGEPGSRQIPMKMSDWVTKLGAFLQFNECQILKDAGNVRHDVAVSLAEKEYEKFRVAQDKNFESDFDKEMKKITSKANEGNNKKQN